MKVGAISLMTTFLLALPLAAFAGIDEPYDDTDGDVIHDSVDNCIDTPNTPQTDADSDGQGDACDNCMNVPNGPSAGPYPGVNGWGTGPGVHGTPTAGYQCDTNHDAYGNACDYDMNNDGLITTTDISLRFNPVFNLPGVFVFVGNNVNNAKVHVDAQEADFNCDNLVSSTDVSLLLNVYWQIGPISANPAHNSYSSIDCKVQPPVPGSCAPHN